jgi:ferritin-like metal-binding protein YciE
MGWFSEEIVSMENLFQHTLEDIYYAENRIQKALPDMIDKASDPELKRGLKKHLAETKGHVKRLEQVFKKLRKEPKGTKCPAIDGIIEEANEIADEVDDKMVLNAALIGAAQAVEHYEITRYGTLIAWARTLGQADIARLLDTNLRQEKAADKKLNSIAKKKINRKALIRGRQKQKKIDRRMEREVETLSVGIPLI